MEKRKFSFELSVYANMEELSEADRLLMEAAINARENAYAPYSDFRVGAAVLLDNNEVVIGNNQENASYPSGLCAERVAVFQAGARFPAASIKRIAICADSTDPAAPCGNCRQSIAEYEQRQTDPIPLLMMGKSGVVYKCNSIEDILPMSFGKAFLK